MNFRIPGRPSALALLAIGAILGAGATTCARPQATDQSMLAEAGAAPAQAVPQPLPASATMQYSVADVAERVVDGVVNISATRVQRGGRGATPFFDNPFGPDMFGPPGDRKQRSLGSGVIVSADGIVLTNNHVVEHGEDIRVVLHDGRDIEARVVGTDPKTDLAVLRLEGKPAGLKALPVGDSSQMRLGDVVLAVGNPFGVGQTVTMGIVSATGRSRMGIVDYEDFIQTDAAINPGNSGGALVNMRGELIGINTAILSRSGGYQGVGFAIPTQLARPVMDALVKSGKFTRGWLGVGIQEVDEALAAGLKLPVKRGVLISDVSAGSPAAKAGLRRGDVVVSLNGRPMLTSGEFRNTIAALGPGTVANLEVLRDGQRHPIKVALGKLEEKGGVAGEDDQTGPAGGGAGALSGVRVRPLDDELRQRLQVADDVKGVVVIEVAPDSAAAQSGVEPGDVIMEINRQPVRSAADFGKLGRAAGGSAVLLLHRRGSTIYMPLRKR